MADLQRDQQDRQSDYLSCAARRNMGCGCFGAWDCAHDDKLGRATLAIAQLGCVACQEARGVAPCGDSCECKDLALTVLRAVFQSEERPG